jgi:hypothetical protein
MPKNINPILFGLATLESYIIATNRKTRGRRGGGCGKSTSLSPISRVPFHKMTAISLTAGSAQLAVNPASAALGATGDLANAFNLYRVVDLEFRLHPNTITGSFQTMSFYPETTVAALSPAQNSEAADSVGLSALSQVPSNWCRVPRNRLQGQLVWWKCVADASAGEFENQGVLVFSGTSTDTLVYEIRGLVELKNPTDAAVQAARVRAEVLKELKQTRF